MRKLVLLLLVSLVMATGPVYASVIIGQATFSDSEFEFSSTGGLTSTYLDGSDYYGIITSFYYTGESALPLVWNEPADDTIGRYFLDLNLGVGDIQIDQTADLGTHAWGDLTSDFATCFDSFSAATGFVLGLKSACFDANILNVADIGNLGKGNFYGDVKLFMTTATAVPAPGALALFGIGIVVIGFASRRRLLSV